MIVCRCNGSIIIIIIINIIIINIIITTIIIIIITNTTMLTVLTCRCYAREGEMLEQILTHFCYSKPARIGIIQQIIIIAIG